MTQHRLSFMPAEIQQIRDAIKIMASKLWTPETCSHPHKEHNLLTEIVSIAWSVMPGSSEECPMTSCHGEDEEQEWCYAKTAFCATFYSISTGRRWELPKGRIVRWKRSSHDNREKVVETLDGSMRTITFGTLLSDISPLEALGLASHESSNQ